MEKDIGINDTQYNICLSIFFFSYAIFEVSVSHLPVSTTMTYEVLGTFQRFPQAAPSFHMAFVFDVLLGYDDGKLLCLTQQQHG